MNSQEYGRWAEAQVAKVLELEGWLVLERRARFREGELDLILERGGELLFVEVKGRRGGGDFGAVVESLTTGKIWRLRKAMWRWRESRRDFRPGRLVFFGVEGEAPVMESWEI